jgi:hypothetical protein
MKQAEEAKKLITSKEGGEREITIVVKIKPEPHRTFECMERPPRSLPKGGIESLSSVREFPVKTD